jgi:hypothetical protein
MKDYLDNLVAKSFGIAEVLAPRPMSLFEPLPADAGPLSTEHYSFEQDVAAPLRSVGLEPTLEISPSPESKGEFPEKWPQPLHASQPSQPFQLSQPSKQPDQSTELRASQSAAPPIPNQPVAVNMSRRADPAERVPLDSRRTVGAHRASEHTPLPAGLHPVMPADRESTSAPEAPFLTRSSSTAPERPETPSRTILVTPAIKPRTDERREPGNPFSDQPVSAPPKPGSSAPAAPTIKITIGRVDVRAMTPDQGTPRPAPERRNAALTLDEYLKRRSGGNP